MQDEPDVPHHRFEVADTVVLRPCPVAPGA
jgi:hypothetical protein